MCAFFFTVDTNEHWRVPFRFQIENIFRCCCLASSAFIGIGYMCNSSDMFVFVLLCNLAYHFYGLPKHISLSRSLRVIFHFARCPCINRFLILGFVLHLQFSCIFNTSRTCQYFTKANIDHSFTLRSRQLL